MKMMLHLTLKSNKWIYTGQILLILVLLTGACRKKEASSDLKVIPLEKQQHTFNTDFYHISVEYPIEQWDYNGDLKQFVDDVVAYYKHDWSPGGLHYEKEMSFREIRDKKQYPKQELVIRYQKYFSTRINVHAYLFSIYVYTGGANGMTTVATFNFNQDGAISYNEVMNLSPEKEVQLAKLIAATALKDRKNFQKAFVYEGLGLNYLNADGSTLDKELVELNNFRFNSIYQNFLLTDEGVRFCFDKYKIATGAVGTPSILLTWDQVVPFVENKFTIN
jgi:hypothetical protein